MVEFVISSTQIMWFFGFVASAWTVYKIIKEIKKPSDDMRETVARHDKTLKDDENRLKDIEESNRMVLQSLLVIINHNITGNGVEKMKQTRDELQEYLINK